MIGFMLCLFFVYYLQVVDMGGWRLWLSKGKGNEMGSISIIMGGDNGVGEHLLTFKTSLSACNINS